MMAAAVDMLEVEGQLGATVADIDAAPHAQRAAAAAQPESSGAGAVDAASMGAAPEQGFHSSGKGGTWKKFKKMVGVQTHHSKTGSSDLQSFSAGGGTSSAESRASSAALPMDPEHAPAHQQQQPLDGSSFGSHASQHTATLAAAALPPASDAASEVAPSEIGRGVSRLSSRYPESVWELGTEDGGDSRRGTLTGMFRKHKKAKAIELDALRFEMGQLQERHALAERDLAAARHELGQLGAERDHLANQVHELTNALFLSRSELASTEAERLRLKELHSQVKTALQDSYGAQQEQQKQCKELEDLCAAQQNSLEEGEERYRSLQEQQDQLHHAALASKAQLVTAQAQLTEARGQREELAAELASLSSQVAALQAEIDTRDEKMSGLEAAAEQANTGLESALGRLRELEHDQHKLEATVSDLQEENLELSTELSGVTELRRQLESQLAEAQGQGSSLAAQVASLQAALERAGASESALTARLDEVTGQLASSCEAGGSLRAQNTELLAELAALREQQAAQSKPGSPLSKWVGRPAKPAVALALPQANGSANGSSGPAANGVAGATGPAAEFSPMTSQLPAGRASSLVAMQAGEVTTGAAAQQAHGAGDGTPSAADCLVIAATATEVLAGADAATCAGGDTATMGAQAAAGLKPPVSSSSPDVGLVKGPLTAARPASRRPGATAACGAPTGLLQLQPLTRQSADGAATAAALAAGCGGGGGTAAQRRLSFGLGGVTPPEGGRPQRQPGDIFSRMFGCLAPRVAEVV